MAEILDNRQVLLELDRKKREINARYEAFSEKYGRFAVPGEALHESFEALRRLKALQDKLAPLMTDKECGEAARDIFDYSVSLMNRLFSADESLLPTSAVRYGFFQRLKAKKQIKKTVKLFLKQSQKLLEQFNSSVLSERM